MPVFIFADNAGLPEGPVSFFSCRYPADCRGRMTDNVENNSTSPSDSARVWLVLAVAAFFAIAVHQHLFHVNSHYYYERTWQWIPSRTVYPILLPLGVPFFLAQVLYRRRPSGWWVGVLMVSSLALMIGGACVQQNPPGFSRIPEVV